MPIHNAIVYATEVLRAYDRALGLADDGGVERVSESVSPTFDLWEYPEWAALRGERLIGFNRTESAVVGEFTYVAIVNPASSGSLVVVDKYAVGAGASITCELRIATEANIAATLAAGQIAGHLDTRWPGAPNAQVMTGRVYVGSDVTTVAGALLEQVFANPFATSSLLSEFRSAIPCVLSPGFGLYVKGNTINTALIVNARWRERRAFPGELQL